MSREQMPGQTGRSLINLTEQFQSLLVLPAHPPDPFAASERCFCVRHQPPVWPEVSLLPFVVTGGRAWAVRAVGGAAPSFPGLAAAQTHLASSLCAGKMPLAGLWGPPLPRGRITALEGALSCLQVQPLHARQGAGCQECSELPAPPTERSLQGTDTEIRGENVGNWEIQGLG